MPVLRPVQPRVLVLSATDRLGGAETSLLTALAELQPGEVQVTLAAPPPNPSALAGLGEAAMRVGIDTVRMPLCWPHFPRNPWQAIRLWRSWRRARTELARHASREPTAFCHANSPQAALQAPPGLPLSLHLRDVLTSARVHRFLRRRVAMVAAISAFVAEYARAQGYPNVQVVPNGLDGTIFRPHAADAKTSPPIVLMAAQPVPWKRHDLFFDVLRRVRAHRADAVGAVAGLAIHEKDCPAPIAPPPALSPGLPPALRSSALLADILAAARPWPGACQRRYEAMAQSHGIADGVAWLGEVPPSHMPRLYACSTVLVHPASNEPWGRAIAEAMASGTPVVAADGGGPAELLGRIPAAAAGRGQSPRARPGELAHSGGILTPPGDARAMAEAALFFLNHPEAARNAGMAGREAARAWTPENSARKLLEAWRAAGLA